MDEELLSAISDCANSLNPMILALNELANGLTTLGFIEQSGSTNMATIMLERVRDDLLTKIGEEN